MGLDLKKVCRISRLDVNSGYVREICESGWMTKINSRQKGKSGELEFAAEINNRLGMKLLERNLDQTRDGGYDLMVNSLNDNGAHPIGKRLNQLAFEVKRRKIINKGDITVWWKQTVEQSNNETIIMHYC